ncbi:hypothetical protein PXY30_004457, partial [Salmonella enterica]|nr:hypothetical protein [Salmonella enterica]
MNNGHGCPLTLVNEKMNLERLYNSLMAVSEQRNGKPELFHHRKKKAGFEMHHIKPRCLGGGDEKENLVHLTPKAHYTAHHILARLYKTRELNHAFKMMSHNGKYRVTSRQYETAKNLLSESMTGEQGRATGYKHTEEAKKKISKANTGRVFSDTHKANISKGKSGATLTEERKKAIGDFFRGKER